MHKLNIKNVIILIAIIALIVCGVMFFKNNNKDINKVIVGSWTTPGGTIYVFNKDKTGIMQVPLTVYEFTYDIKDGKIIIDFKDESAFDPTYEYTLDGDKINLKGEHGNFTFTKVEFDQNKIKKTNK